MAIDTHTETGPMAMFRQHLQDGRFMIQKAPTSGRHVWPPRVFEPGNLGDMLEWVPAKGTGVVYAMTTVRRRADRGGDYNLALVELDEGPRIMSRVEGLPPDDVVIGMSVVARVETPPWSPDNAEPVIVFYPSERASR